MSAIVNITTLEKLHVRKYRLMISQYESIKSGDKSRFSKLQDFYDFHGVSRKNFLKYYNRYNNDPDNIFTLLPEKRGPKYRTRRPLPFIENKVVELRLKGNNRYDINHALKPVLKKHTPSPSGVYNILKRHKLNKLTPKMKKEKRLIVSKKAGELGHVDCHYLEKGIVSNNNKKLYLACILDGCTRIAWAEVIEDIKSITVMFSILRSINMMSDVYNIKFERILTDNGPEFGPKKSKSKDTHPFERMLKELDIKHTYTRPYRPQTNGKIERFWKTLKQDMLEDTQYKDIQTLREELLNYLVYYNEHRYHSSLKSTPYSFRKLLPN